MAKRKVTPAGYTVPVPEGYVPTIPDFGPGGQPFTFTGPPPPPAPPPVDDGPVDDYYDPGPGGYEVQYLSAPPRPAYDPASDPSYQALLAQLATNETTYRTQAARRIQQAQDDAALAGPRILEQGVETRRGINANAEGRGLFRSGARLRNLALQQRGEQQRIQDVERGTARQVGNINDALAQQIMDLARQRTDADFQARLRAAG